MGYRVMLYHFGFYSNNITAHHCSKSVEQSREWTDYQRSWFKQKEACFKALCIAVTQNSKKYKSSAGRDSSKKERKSKRKTKNPEDICYRNTKTWIWTPDKDKGNCCYKRRTTTCKYRENRISKASTTAADSKTLTAMTVCKRNNKIWITTKEWKN